MPKISEHLPYELPDECAVLHTQSTYAAIVRAVKKYVPAGASILDVGCGRGELMHMLAVAGYAVNGCDIDEECISISSAYGRTFKLDIDNLAGSLDEKFDCIVMSHVLEHVENPHQTLISLSDMSKGTLIISVPNPYNSPHILKSLLRKGAADTNPKHLYSWDWHHFKTFAERGCGLELVDYYHDSVSLPLPYRTRVFLARKKLLKPIEHSLLRAAFPWFCNSITAVLRKNPD